MLIECTLKRQQKGQHGSDVEFPAWPNENYPNAEPTPSAKYRFAPKNNDELAPHVAEVVHPEHIKRLLSIDGFRLHGLTSAPASAPVPHVSAAASIAQPIGAVAAQVAVSTPAPTGEGSAAPVTPPPPVEVPANIKEICDLSVRDLKAKINTYNESDLRAAAAAELARTDDRPRKIWIEVIEAHFKK